MVHLAQHKQRPAIPKHLKLGWETADRYFWCYMDHAKFTKRSLLPDAETGQNWKSKSDQEMVGVRDFPLQVYNRLT